MLKKIACAFMLAAASLAPCSAAEVDFSIVMRDQDGKPYTDCLKMDSSSSPPKCAEEINVTLGRLAWSAINVAEQGLSPEDVVRRGILAQRVYKAAKIDLEAKDVELIKAAIIKRGFQPVAVVEAFRLLDPASVKK